MLGYVPGGIVTGGLNITWNDYQRQASSLGDTHGEKVANLSDGDLAMRSHYANIPHFLTYGLMLEELAGFSMDNIAQAIEFGVPPEACLVMRVREIPETLVSFWETVDYERKENEFGSYWTIGEDREMDILHPVQGRMIARFNNIAILDDTTIAYAPTLRLLEGIQAVAAGESESSVHELEPLFVTLPIDTSSLWFLDGEMLMFEGLVGSQSATAESLAQLEETFESSNDAVGSMPVIRSVCTGLTAGASIDETIHNPEARDFIVLETDAAEMAQQAADVVTWRGDNLDSLINRVPYTELIPNLEVQALTSELMICTNELDEAPPQFSRLLISGDTLLFAYRYGGE